MTDHDELRSMVEELMWSALAAGRRAGDPMTPSRMADELEAEVWDELQRVLRHIEKALASR